jgi:ABC-type methionine transport system ATPase subunit
MANQDMSSIIVERRKALRMTQRDLADVLQVDIAVLFSRTPKADVLSKEDQTDYKAITKFKILSGLAAALIFFSSGFGFSLRFVADNSGPYVALVIVMAVFAFGGVVLGGSSLAWFRSFYKGKFYNDLYCKDYYGVLVILAASLLPLIYSVAMKNFGNEAAGEKYYLFGAAAATVALLFALLPWGKKGDMLLAWNPKTIIFLVLGVAFAKWAKSYETEARLTYDPPFYLKFAEIIPISLSYVSTFVIYFNALHTSISVADYFAFLSAYGLVSGAFATLISAATSIAEIKPMMSMVKPFLDTVPEIAENKKAVTHLSGAIELNNVSFRYSEDMPLILDNLSLKIHPGQYIAIVGSTGCGKSTLMRLMLGFETPQKGAVYYDGKDLNSLDLKSLRRHIGTVMQDGKLFQGDIFSNITISAPYLTLDEAWAAAEVAGIAEDIKAMPMGMNTLVSEGAGGIWGGQRQRLLIARAMAPKPRVLMFDEATSALDNLTQKQVTEALDKLKCTKIVIAHRLSTIKGCDRIIVLDKGKIVEDGGYDELLQKNGFFADLVARQRLDDTAYVGKTTVF